MKKLIYIVISIFFLSLGSAIAEEKNAIVNQSSDSKAGDTYNFYFQKAPGPTTVNQGTSGDSPAPATASKPTETNEAVEAEEEAVSASQSNEVAKEQESRWSMSLLYGRSRDELRMEAMPSFGLSLGVQLNKNIGLGMGMIKGRSEFGGRVDESTDFFFGVNFMPLKSNFASGGSMEFGVGLGLMTSDYLASKTDFGSSLFSDVPRTKSYSATKIVAYAGPQINLLFNRSFGITMESRFASGKSQQYGAGLIFRF